MKEIWKTAVIGHKKLDMYMVSNLGNVKVLQHSINYVSKGKLVTRMIKEHELVKHSNGLDYLQVALNYEGQVHQTLVHKLVLNTFQPLKPQQLDSKEFSDVDHIDNNRSNNVLSNLRYISHQANLNKPHRLDQFKKPVLLIDGDIQYIFPSASEAAEHLNLSIGYTRTLLYSGKQYHDCYLSFIKD